jgi:ADP-ribose pyrophosphatase
MQVIKKRTLFTGRIFDISRIILKDKDGNKSIRETVVHPGAVAIVPLISEDRIILVRQYRYPARRYLWELPAGTLDKKESPFSCAKRELLEETGFLAKRIRKIAEFYTCPGFCTEKMYLFVAEKLKFISQKLDSDEKIVSRIFNCHQIRHLLGKNKIMDAKTIIGLNLWQQQKRT